jgi:hypothetical protein
VSKITLQDQITDKQEKEQFKWVIENYFKLVHHKDWRVSFNSISDDCISSNPIVQNFA